MKRIIIFVVLLFFVFPVHAQETEYPEPFDRGIGLPNNRFIPKGTVGGGLTVSYYLGSSAGAAISLILALIFAVTFSMRKVRG